MLLDIKIHMYNDFEENPINLSFAILWYCLILCLIKTRDPYSFKVTSMYCSRLMEPLRTHMAILKIKNCIPKPTLNFEAE